MGPRATGVPKGKKKDSPSDRRRAFRKLRRHIDKVYDERRSVLLDGDDTTDVDARLTRLHERLDELKHELPDQWPDALEADFLGRSASYVSPPVKPSRPWLETQGAYRRRRRMEQAR
jgi:hypothetical protein